jgi:predicted transcriptional regulator of viral defense system
MAEAQYAQTQGILLLQKIVSAVGPIFTIAEAQAQAEALGITPARVRWILSRLARGGTLGVARLKRGVYALQSPLLGAELHPYAIAAALIRPVAISHWSALAHHGLTTQIPPMVQACTPHSVVTPEMREGQAYRPRGRATWRVLGLEFEFVVVGEKRFFGFQQEWVSQWHRVAVTDSERTVLDMVASPRMFGTLGTGLEVLEAHLSRLDLDRLVGYALRYDVGAVIKRLGWMLEALGVPESTTGPLHAYPVRSYYRLDPTRPPGGTPVPRWRVRNNLPKEGNDADR